MLATYDSLFLCSLDADGRARTCNYWYTVTNGASAHTAFRTKAHLLAWMGALELTVNELIPNHGERESMRLYGSYSARHEHDINKLIELDCIGYFYALNNADYTVGKVTRDANGKILLVTYHHGIGGFTHCLDYHETQAALDSGNFLVDKSIFDNWASRQLEHLAKKEVSN